MSRANAKTILITGASSGLGAEMARQFAAAGHDLALCARRVERLEELRDEILAARAPGSTQPRVEVRALDVNDADQVFEVFRGFRDAFAANGPGAAAGRTLDRIVINAGLGKGAPLGTGGHAANRETAMTNFVGALTQAEAAMEVFRAQDAGHLVMISSMSAVRGLPRSMTTYAATKAGVAHLAEGLRNELLGKPIKVTVLYPGYIASEMNERVARTTPLMVSTEKGVRAMVDAIEKEKASAHVPALPWAPLSVVMRHAPLPVFKKLM
jgi:short-subunit dehydrogenase